MWAIVPCALWSLADATIFMAEVIFRVLFTVAMRPLTSFNDAISVSF
jgi:hypothetical protein